jgi:signal peptidase I
LEGYPLAELFKKKSDNKPEKSYTGLQSLVLDLHDLVYLVAIILIIYLLMFRVVIVVGSSMYDTLVEGDRIVILNSFIYRQPKQGDIIVCSKESFRDGECIVKRVIATEGQVVDIDSDTGTVYVDGVALEEEYVYSMTVEHSSVTFPLRVDPGCVFVMGDNRGISLDSRYAELGLIDYREIMGKAIFLLFPGEELRTGPLDFSRFGVIK